MSVIAPGILILGRSPLDATGLGGDDDELGAVGECLTLNEGVVHTQWAEGADIDLFHLLFKV